MSSFRIVNSKPVFGIVKKKEKVYVNRLNNSSWLRDHGESRKHNQYFLQLDFLYYYYYHKLIW